MSSLTEWRPLCLPAVLHFYFHNCSSSFVEKEGTLLPNMHHDLAFPWPPVHRGDSVWLRAESRNVRFWPIGILCCDWLVCGAVSPSNTNKYSRKKAESLLICEICQCFTFRKSYYFTEQRKLRPAALALHFLNPRLCSVTTHCNSYCLQVTGEPERWIQVPNELTLCSS